MGQPAQQRPRRLTASGRPAANARTTRRRPRRVDCCLDDMRQRRRASVGGVAVACFGAMHNMRWTRMMRVGVVTSLAAAFVLASVVAADAAAPTPGLVQKSGTAGCISFTGRGPCVSGRGLGGARAVSVSPDGKGVYVASEGEGAVAVFDRALDGRLTRRRAQRAAFQRPERCLTEGPVWTGWD